MRFGLVGTGPWAQAVHGPGLLAAPQADLVGVWGRDPVKAGALAERLGVTVYDDYARMLSEVKAVAFAVPPDAQAELATRAADAGRHLLLDKPVATEVVAARRLAEVVAARGVASVVFFTDRFADQPAAWMADAVATGRWLGGSVRWLAALDTPGNPYAASAWRWDRGALWDLGPHALSTLSTVLGPVRAVDAVAGARDVVHLVLTHDSGATSTATLSMQMPPAAVDYEVVLYGETGTARLAGRDDVDAASAYLAAVRHLCDAVEASDNPLDVAFGVQVVELLAAAEAAMSARSGDQEPGLPV